MSATVCLINVARCVKDRAIPQVQQFTQDNINKRATPADWRCREAALTAFGCLVSGPSRDALLPLVKEALLFLLDDALQDAVRCQSSTITCCRNGSAVRTAAVCG